MKEYSSIHEANNDRASGVIGRGEVIAVSGRSFRNTVMGLKSVRSSYGESLIGKIPGSEHYNRASGGGKARNSVR